MLKTVLLAGGFGTRILEKTQNIPKPMIEIGTKPLLWHLMQIYGSFGVNEFFIALGYKQEAIKEYFLNYYAMNHDITVDLKKGNSQIYDGDVPDWKVHLIDTGLKTQTGGRVKRLSEWIGQETFMLTYGDGLANINIEQLIQFHKSHGKLATVTAVRPPARFGGLVFEDNLVTTFTEKPQIGEGWVNGGYFVLEPQVMDYINGDETIWEKDPLENLAKDKQLVAFKHEGFFQPMDTLREYKYLQKLWDENRAPWKLWDKVKV